MKIIMEIQPSEMADDEDAEGPVDSPTSLSFLASCGDNLVCMC